MVIPIDTIEIMKDPYKWRKIVLPLKRHDPFVPGNIGLLIGNGPTVYLANLWSIEDLTKVDKIQYSTFQALVDDGWVID